MKYTVRKQFLGGWVVTYACENCHGSLESPLHEAGTEQECPTCQNKFITPGEAELEKTRSLAIRDKAIHVKPRRVEVRTVYVPSPPPKPREMVWYGAMRCFNCGYPDQFRAERVQEPTARKVVRTTLRLQSVVLGRAAIDETIARADRCDRRRAARSPSVSSGTIRWLLPFPENSGRVALILFQTAVAL